jgi:RNA polymerase sigma factor (sigma-70 family)
LPGYTGGKITIKVFSNPFLSFSKNCILEYVCLLPAMQNNDGDINTGELWEQLRKGNAEAYGSLVKYYYQDLFKYGSSFTRDEELVKDCMQDLFLSLWKNRDTIRDTAFVKYYLLKSLRRLIARSLEKSKWFSKPVEPQFDGGFDNSLTADNILIRDEMLLEQSRRMREVLSRLSKRQQEVIYLRYYADAETADIADIMGISRQSVYNLLHDALNKMKAETGMQGGPELLLSLLVTTAILCS